MLRLEDLLGSEDHNMLPKSADYFFKFSFPNQDPLSTKNLGKFRRKQDQELKLSHCHIRNPVNNKSVQLLL